MLKIVALACGIFLIHTNSWAELNSRAKIYELGSARKKLLFTYQQDREEAAGLRTLKTIYADANTKETVVDEVSEFKLEGGKARLLRFKTVQKQTGSEGACEIRDKKVYFKYTKDGKTKEASEDLEENFVISPSILGYLQDHWSEIRAGKTIKVRLGVMDRLETVGFEFTKVKEVNVDGEKALVLKMKPSSFFIAALVNPLHWSITEDGAHLLTIEGRTAPKLKSEDGLKDLDAESVYERISSVNSK